MDSLTNINSWRRRFGLHPVLMNPQNDEHKFLLLDGGNRDFFRQFCNLTGKREPVETLRNQSLCRIIVPVAKISLSLRRRFKMMLQLWDERYLM